MLVFSMRGREEHGAFCKISVESNQYRNAYRSWLSSNRYKYNQLQQNKALLSFAEMEELTKLFFSNKEKEEMYAKQAGS